jgi:hypothetical protein
MSDADLVDQMLWAMVIGKAGRDDLFVKFVQCDRAAVQRCLAKAESIYVTLLPWPFDPAKRPRRASRAPVLPAVDRIFAELAELGARMKARFARALAESH